MAKLSLPFGWLHRFDREPEDILVSDAKRQSGDFPIEGEDGHNTGGAPADSAGA